MKFTSHQPSGSGDRSADRHDPARRRLGKAAAALVATGALAGIAGCKQDTHWNATNLTGSALPDLKLSMTRADDNKQVTADDYKGKVVLLYFGYTFCPDVCPLTLANIAQILQKLGKSADDVRVLFVTVDPNRDTLPVLQQYTTAFAPQIDGLRGTPDQLTALAKRYRVAYTVKPSKNPADYVVTHSSAVYVFDGKGDIRLLFSSLSRNDPKIDQHVADLKKLIAGQSGSGLFGWFDSLT